MGALVATEKPARSPALHSNGPISELICELLARPVAAVGDTVTSEAIAPLSQEVADPLTDDDFQLALYLCYELHYRSFAGVDPGWEWDPGLLAARAVLERQFDAALAAAVPIEPVDPDGVGDALFELERADDGPSLSRHLETVADFEQFREFVVHRSLYQLKESDPHSWAIPRLRGRRRPRCSRSSTTSTAAVEQSACTPRSSPRRCAGWGSTTPRTRTWSASPG